MRKVFLVSFATPQYKGDFTVQIDFSKVKNFEANSFVDCIKEEIAKNKVYNKNDVVITNIIDLTKINKKFYLERK